MKKTVLWLAWTSLGLLAVLAALNWTAMLATSDVNLVLIKAQLPLGLVMLALALVPLTLFFMAYLQQQISTLMETRRLLKEVHHAHELADKAEASRIEGLRKLMVEGFGDVNARLDSLDAVRPQRPIEAPAAPASESVLRRTLPGPWRSR